MGAAATIIMPAGEQPSMLKQVKRAEWEDPEARAANTQVLLGLGLFAGAIVVIRNFGDLFVPVF